MKMMSFSGPSFLVALSLVGVSLAGCSNNSPTAPENKPSDLESTWDSQAELAKLKAKMENSTDPFNKPEEMEATGTEVKIDRREFASGESQTYRVKSEQPMMVGFRTNFSNSMKSKIQPHNDKFGSELNVAAKIDVVDTAYYLGTNVGGATYAFPTDGEFELKVSNFVDGPLDILIFKKPLTADELKSLEDARAGKR